MASAQVLLGLTPSVLSLLGPGIEEVAMLSTIGRRPVLAFLIAAGSPVVKFSRPFVYKDPTKVLQDHDGRLWVSKSRLLGSNGRFCGIRKSVLLTLFEYGMACLSVSLLSWTCMELAMRTICNFAPHIPFLPLLWTFMTMIVHIGGGIAMHLRLSRVSAFTGQPEKWSIRKWIRMQFVPMKTQGTLRVEAKQETYKYIAISWLSGFLVISHIIFGTLTWSSLLFVSVRDGVTVIVRYIACQILSRTVLVIELAAMRDAYNTEGSHTDEFEFKLISRVNSDALKPGSEWMETVRRAV